MREVSFTKEEIVAQSDVEKIGSDINMLVVEIDQQKYGEYLFSESGNLTETRSYHRVRFNTRESGNRKSTVNRRLLETAAIEPSFGQETLAGGDISTAEESLKTSLTRAQLRNRNRRATQKALKARVKARLIRQQNARLQDFLANWLALIARPVTIA